MFHMNYMDWPAIRKSVLVLALFSSSPELIAETTKAQKILGTYSKKSSFERYLSRATKRIVPKMNYSYINFKYDSTTGDSYNRYGGKTNIYMMGFDNIQFNNKYSAGFSLFQIDTGIESSTLLTPLHPMSGQKTMSNNTFLVHLTRKFTRKFLMDLIASHGENATQSFSQIEEPDNEDVIGLSYPKNKTNLLGLTGIYRKPYKKFNFNFSLGGIFNQASSGTSMLYFVEPTPPKASQPLTTQTGLIFENVVASYKFSRNFTPFVSGGLIQVAYFSTSRAVILTTNLVGPIPQMVMNTNAYRLAAGFSINRKNYTVRLEERYYNSANILTSFTTALGANFRFG